MQRRGRDSVSQGDTGSGSGLQKWGPQGGAVSARTKLQNCNENIWSCHAQKYFKQNIFISQVLLECGTIRRGEEQATVCRFPLRGDPKEMRTTRMGATRRVIAVCHGSGLRIAVVRWAGDGGHQGSNLNYVRRTSRVIYPTSSVPESQGKPRFHTKYP